MDDVNLARFALAFAFVIGLIGVFAFCLKRVSQKSWTRKQEPGRLQILETRYLDPKRRLVLVKRDGMEHLLLLGEGSQLVVESFAHSPMMPAPLTQAATDA